MFSRGRSVIARENEWGEIGRVSADILLISKVVGGDEGVCVDCWVVEDVDDGM